MTLKGLQATDLIVKRSLHDFNKRKSINTVGKGAYKSVELPRLSRSQSRHGALRNETKIAAGETKI